MGDSHPVLLTPAQNAEVTASLTRSLQAAAVKKQKETQLLRQADLLVLPAIVDQVNT